MLINDDFSDYPPLLSTIEKINKLYNKDKFEKISKILDGLEPLLDDVEFTLPVLYIFSIIAEKNVEIIKKEIIEKIKKYINENDIKLKLNAITVLGFFLLANPKYVRENSELLINQLEDINQDIRDNTHYFLCELLEEDPSLINSYVDLILNAFKIEDNKENINFLLIYLNYFEEEILSFDQIYRLRKILIKYIKIYSKEKKSEIFQNLITIIKKSFLNLGDKNLKGLTSEEIIKCLNEHYIMKKHVFNNSNDLKLYTAKIKESDSKNEELYFYIKNKEDKTITFFEIEKEIIEKIFNINSKISNDFLIQTFSQIISNRDELNRFIEILLKLGQIKGYYSKLGFFYPYRFIESEINQDFLKNGLINLRKKYNFLPPKIINSIIGNLKFDYLINKDGTVYYLFKNINEKISSAAAKNSTIDLKKFRNKLKDEDFIKLIKNMPQEYLSKYHKGTVWLTNLGKIRIEKELENSFLLGFIDLEKISRNLKINKILLLDLMLVYVDSRSGIWNKNKDIFYFSRFVKNKIEDINALSKEINKDLVINDLAINLNIDKTHLIDKIDENYKLIGEEIKKQDKINIDEYLKKMGIEYDAFIDFLNDLQINYFKKGNTLILNPEKVEEAKNSIKHQILENSKSMDFLSFGNFDITSHIIEDLIIELRKDGKLKGIFAEQNDDIIFYTQKGIQNLMLDYGPIFSFEDLFYGKELTQEEFDILKEILDELLKNKKLKGSFDEKSITFSSDDAIFSRDYNTYVYKVKKIVNNYIQRFDYEFQQIKLILRKRNEIIYPQEIKKIQDSIDKINNKYVAWRDGLYSYIRRSNIELLKAQGYSIKKYIKLDIEKKDDVKNLEEDPEILDLMEGFKLWIKLFNEIELKYPNILFFQKRLINTPNDEETKKNLEELLFDLNLI